MNDYKLSASLEGHEDDVRGVVFPHPSFVLSASRDATVRLWKLLSNRPPRYDCTVSTHGSAFINAVAYLPPSSTYPDGLILSGGKETLVEARQPGKPEENAEALLLGHESNVCALDVSAEGGWVVSGSWDASARVWRVGKWECEALLEGHEGSVWDVLAYDRETIITACADHLIRVFSPSGKRLHTIRGNTDVVRALCRVLKGHPSKAEFASASNDGVIRLWRLDGYQVGELRGHDSFIYSLASLPSGELVSSGEDRTVRIWRGDECVQTITHPAISVWGVAVCQENGDIISGASDRIVRIFSRVKERQAEPHVLQAFEDSVKSSSIPQQAVGEVNKEKLPGPEFLLQKSGTKEGQVVMIREADGSVTAHQWSQGAQLWLNVGTVVDAVGSTGKKKEYQDTHYDYVFDVDIEDGKPPLKLPYNLSQNPYEAATTFIQENHLPMTYLDQIRLGGLAHLQRALCVSEMSL
ncbi:polyubiquitin binding protein (doa1 ufd3) [Lasallia pustulata]|uniref:Polyubiquitin binding protein (Doa1 ufd3) n=1 Tax=Lasallia pustulata TaxID=136370 RepID=A0A1W5CVK7_9LECA|nr:polyubiquitin binding protein (doa1 ufd3) [Lasallia pustulata]